MELAVIGANPWFVEALSAMGRESGRFRVALVAADAAELGRAGAGAAEIAPEIAIVACRAVEGEAATVIRWAKRHRPGLRVIVKHHALRPEHVRDAMQIGAWGIFSAEDPPETLMNVLQSVAAGRVSFPFVDFATLREDPFEQLTRREQEVLRALSEGWTNEQISRRLGISPNTVKYHLKLIYDKLGVTNRSTAVAQFVMRQHG